MGCATRQRLPARHSLAVAIHGLASCAANIGRAPTSSHNACWAEHRWSALPGVRLQTKRYGLPRFAPAIDDLRGLFLAERPKGRDGGQVRGSRARLATLPQVDRLARSAQQETDLLRRQPQATPVRCQSLRAESEPLL